MTDTPDEAGPDYLAEIAELTELVESGHTLVDEGNTIDLSNLEEAIGDLCRRMAEVPPADANAVTAAIENLVQRLNALGNALQAQAGPRQ